MIGGFDFGPDRIVLGLFTGLTYGLLAVGLVLVYRSSRFVNFAHGAIGVFGAAVLGRLVGDEGAAVLARLPGRRCSSPPRFPRAIEAERGPPAAAPAPGDRHDRHPRAVPVRARARRCW